MVSSPLGSDGNMRRSGYPLGAPAPQTRATGQPAAERALLESVLQWTEATLWADDPLEAADVDALRQVARRHPGAPLSPDPVAVELVQAMLQTQFAVHADWLPVWQGASGVIAQTLFEDPGARERLEVLWSRLVGELTH
jgi:hypothetical protein